MFKKFSFYDPETIEGTKTGDAGTPGSQTTATPPRSYSQEEYAQGIESERKMASEKTRQLTLQLEELKGKVGDRTQLETTINELKESLLTKEELAAKKLREKEELSKNEITNLTKERDTWQTRFQSTLIQRQLLDSASKEGAFDPGIFINLLKDSTQTSEVIDDEGKATGNFKVVVRLDSTDKDGKTKVLTLTPDEAIKYLKDQPEKYGYLFKGVGTPGAGLNTGNKTFTTADLENMTPEQYNKVRAQLMG